MAESSNKPERLRRRTTLTGRAGPGLDELAVALVTQSQRRRRATAGTALGRVQRWPPTHTCTSWPQWSPKGISATTP